MNLLDGFLRQCETKPEAPALVDGAQVLGYAGLREKAAGIAACLKQVGVGPGRRVAICLDRGIDAAMAIFGTLCAGACYVPLDVKNPAARLAFIGCSPPEFNII